MSGHKQYLLSYDNKWILHDTVQMRMQAIIIEVPQTD